MDLYTILARTSHWFCGQIAVLRTAAGLLRAAAAFHRGMYEPVTQLLLRSKVAQKMERKKSKYDSKLSKNWKLLLCARNHSQLVKSAQQQHKVVSGSHCLSGNTKPVRVCC